MGQNGYKLQIDHISGQGIQGILFHLLYNTGFFYLQSEEELQYYYLMLFYMPKEFLTGVHVYLGSVVNQTTASYNKSFI